MEKKLTLLLITTLILTSSARANFNFDSPADYTGEAFFSSPVQAEKKVSSDNEDDDDSNGTVPPIKQLRLKLQEMQRARQMKDLAPTMVQETYTGEIETSEYASKEIEENFEEMSPDGFESEAEISTEEKKKKSFWSRKKKAEELEDSEDMVLDCEKIDYDTNNFMVYATGNVRIEFVKQGTVVFADIITFDRIKNTVKAEGNVKIVKNGQTITGDYIFVDLNEENALIENPLTKTATIDAHAKKGYMYGDKIVQEDGELVIEDSFPIQFRTGNRGPRIRTMYVPKDETLSEDMQSGIITLKAQDIKFTQKGDIEILSFKKPQLFKGDKKVFKTNSIKFYTNKNHDYGETNHWEIGYYRGLGMYAGPGVVFELPKGSVLKAMPILNYKSGIGIGGLARFNSGTNRTVGAYGSAEDRFIVLGEQKLDDNLHMQYGMNAYMDEWFLGRRRPKYGASVVYRKDYNARDFLIKNRTSSFQHRLYAGYYEDLDFDHSFEKIKGTNMGTTRFRYMAHASQNFYEYRNPEEMKAFAIGVSAQLSSALYGTGDTQVIGRLGPGMHIQYKRWMQDVGFFLSAFEDNTPMPVYDSYRYGKQSVYLREYFRLCRWLTVAWFGNLTISNDAPNGRDLQENAFYFSFGPEDIKMNLGYDFVRQTLRCTFDVMMDAKGTKVEYDTLEITQDKKAQASKKKEEPANKKETAYRAPTQPKVLNKAIVEDVRIHEDVL